MPTYVLTGSNRGLGLEFVRQLSKSDNIIFAGVRSLSGEVDELKSLASSSKANIHIFEADYASPPSLDSFSKRVISTLSGSKIDILINNAGINAVPQQTAMNIEPSDLHTHVDINVIGPALLTAHLAPHLAKGGVVVDMTSGLGSMGKGVVKCTTYAISKAALNMLAVHQAEELKTQGVRVVLMDPGWVKTRMGGTEALITADESITNQLSTIEKVHQGKDGGELGKARFYNNDGTEVPW